MVSDSGHIPLSNVKGETKKKCRHTYKVDEDIQQLPNSNTWVHRPVFLSTGEKTVTPSYFRQSDESLPINRPIDFDGELFKGKILMRIRDASNTSNTGQNIYFQGKRRTKQIVIQGQFKERLSCGDVWFGDLYEKPLNMHNVAQYAVPLIQRLVPGIVMDILSEKPRIMVLLAGESRTLSVDYSGEEPDIMGTLEENHVERTGIFKSIRHRRKTLRKPKTASQFFFEPAYVYTFQLYDDVIDIHDFSVKLPFGKIPLLHYVNYQPLTFAAMTKDQRSIFSFRVFHEKLLEGRKERAETEAELLVYEKDVIELDSDSEGSKRSSLGDSSYT